MEEHAELVSLREKVKDLERLASLGILTAGVAHEIKNPLNFVSNFAELSIELLDELATAGSAEEVQELIQNIRKNQEKIHLHSKRADSIVRSILGFSKSDEDVKQPTDINKLIEEYLHLAYHSVKSEFRDFNCNIEKHLDPDLPAVNIVSSDISRVVLNLINNALYAIRDRENATIRVSTQKADGGVIFSIHDNGTGIPETLKNRIFEPFFTTKPGKYGTGLGLSLSADIVRAHNGKIMVDSSENEFTEFNVFLPLNS